MGWSWHLHVVQVLGVLDDSSPHPIQQCDVTAANTGFDILSYAKGSIGRRRRWLLLSSPRHRTPVSFLSSRQAEVHASESLNMRVSGVITLSYEEQPQGTEKACPLDPAKESGPICKFPGVERGGDAGRGMLAPKVGRTSQQRLKTGKMAAVKGRVFLRGQE